MPTVGQLEDEVRSLTEQVATLASQVTGDSDLYKRLLDALARAETLRSDLDALTKRVEALDGK